MNKHSTGFTLLLLLAASAAAAEPESCDVLRERIRARTGLVEPEGPLLRQLAERQDCRFTSAEIYRAAYGDRPLPPPEERRAHRRRHDDDDD
jgi:hypothetical protein